MTTPAATPPRAVLARQLAFGFGSVVAVALTMCALLLALINDVAGLVTHMRHDESSISAGLQLATAVREQALALTRALLGPSADALARHQQARARVQAGLDTLGPACPRSSAISWGCYRPTCARWTHSSANDCDSRRDPRPPPARRCSIVACAP